MTRKSLWTRCIATGWLCAAASPTPINTQPASTRHPVAYDTYHGVRVADPFRWLENGSDPAVKAWSAAQNTRTRSYLDARPERKALAAALKQIEDSSSASDSSVTSAGGRLFALTHFPGRQQPVLTTLAPSGEPSSRRTVLDVGGVAADGSSEIDWFVPSHDGRQVAVSLSSGGSEIGTLHVFDVASGHEIGQPIDEVQRPAGGGSLAWSANDSGFWYTRYPGAASSDERDFNEQVFYHPVGADPATDKAVLTSAKGLPRTAEIFLSNPHGAASALASVQLGDGGQWQHFLLSTQHARLIAGYEAKIKTATLAQDGTVYGISVREDASGEVVRIAPDAAPTSIVPADRHRAAFLNDQIVVSGDRVFVIAADGGPNHIVSYTLDGSDPRPIAAPPVSAVSALQPLPGGDLLYCVQTYTRPAQMMRWVSSSRQSVETPMHDATSMDFSAFETTRLFATSRDGVRIPITLIARKGLQKDGTTPLVLYGYGGFGLGETPELLPSSIYLWLKAGGAYAVANIRGGNEYGDSWHTAGMLTRKQTVFDDFFAAAQFLKAQRYTSTDKLALRGGSNGGLLMGATLTQHPDLAHAIVATVGIYDMLRLEQAANGVFNVSEYGTIKDAEQFRALYGYSPLQHVRPGLRYPALFLATGANDGRVDPFQSRKFAAALQEADPKALILLRTSAKAGHGIGSSVDERIALQADYLTFLFDQFALRWPAQ